MVQVKVPIRTQNIAGMATVAASSAASQNQAVKAIDGLIDGAPDNYRLEWSSVKQRAGAGYV